MKVSATRLTAYDVLRDVEERDAYANLALPSRLRQANLAGRDAAFVTELVSGTLRLQGFYDAVLELASSRKIDDIDPRTRRVLRLGAHQLLNMRVPSHAALNESVELQRKVANPKATGFVNGVLRTVLREDSWQEKLAAELTGDALLAAKYSHPAWIVRALRDALRADGRENDLEHLLTADNQPPKVQLAVLDTKDGAADDNDTIIALAEPFELTATGVSPLGLELHGGDPGVLQQKTKDLATIRVQDQGSQLAALALVETLPVVAGEKWLDLCAGPGGKTAVLADCAKRVDATLYANESAEHRAKLVENALSDVDDSVVVRCADGRTDAAFGGAEQMYDRILVDAPCTGLGALRRRPEARWRKQPGDVPELTRLQGELLAKAYAHLKPGGVIAYVTCSPHLAETRLIADRLQKTTSAKPLNTPEILQKIARVPLHMQGDTYAQLWPHAHDTDAMFVALFTKP